MWQTLLLSLLGLASSAAFHPAVAPQRRQSFTVHASTLVEPTLPPRRPGGAVPKVIFVDGNNLMMQRKVTKGRENLAEKLSAVKEGAFQIVLVFDGRKGEAASVVGEHPQVVVTSGGDETTGEGRMSADEYIVEAARHRRQADACRGGHRGQVAQKASAAAGRKDDQPGQVVEAIPAALAGAQVRLHQSRHKLALWRQAVRNAYTHTL